jgi:hypothetical protein
MAIVKYRTDATRFPTDQAAYKALCDIEARPGEFTLRQYRGDGWFAKLAVGKGWLRHDSEPKVIHQIQYRVGLTSWRVYEEFEDAEHCRATLATYRKLYPVKRVEFRVNSRPAIDQKRATYGQYLPEIGSELLRQMEACADLQRQANALRRRVMFSINTQWDAADITRAKIIAKETYERTTGKRCYGAAVMDAF